MIVETYLDGSTVRSKEEPMFEVKDSGKREEFAGGMVRDTAEGKTDYTRVLAGPMFDRWAEHLDKGGVKYPDVAPGIENWTLAEGEAEYQRFRKSAFRHLRQWLRGDTDEDHAAAVFFNINGAEYVKARMDRTPRYTTTCIDPAITFTGIGAD